MKYKILSILFVVSIIFSSCKKENKVTYYEEVRKAEVELIKAIQEASKQMIDGSELPADAIRILLTSEFYKSHNEKSELANELGYQVRMRIVEGIRIGVPLKVYFDLEGKRLRLHHDGYISSSFGVTGTFPGPTPEECINLVYPVTYIMPGGTEIEEESEEDLELAIKAWYNENLDIEDKPALQYPVDVIFENGFTQTVNDDDELWEAYFECE